MMNDDCLTDIFKLYINKQRKYLSEDLSKKKVFLIISIKLMMLKYGLKQRRQNL